MKVRNVVKVMNFHSLLRVDSAKKTALKYQMMEEQLIDMIDGIVNNRNLMLDKKALKVNEDAPVLSIYLGSDFGFCSSFNSRVNEEIQKDTEGLQVLIGRKLNAVCGEHVIFRQNSEEFRSDMSSLQKLVVRGINRLEYSRIYIVYNHYINTTTVQLQRKQLYPVVTARSGRRTADFVVEGDLSRLLKNLIISYVNYEIMLADVFSKAGENLMRQNATNESLKRIDEMEEEQKKVEIRSAREKEFAKVIDNFVRMRGRNQAKPGKEQQ
jgi:F0F1-type ATP synthase gamma subunit